LAELLVAGFDIRGRTVGCREHAVERKVDIHRTVSVKTNCGKRLRKTDGIHFDFLYYLLIIVFENLGVKFRNGQTVDAQYR